MILTELFLLFQRSRVNNSSIHYVFFSKRDATGELIRITAYEELKITVNSYIYAALALLIVPLYDQNLELTLIFNQQLSISTYTQGAKIRFSINCNTYC